MNRSLPSKVPALLLRPSDSHSSPTPRARFLLRRESFYNPRSPRDPKRASPPPSRTSQRHLHHHAARGSRVRRSLRGWPMLAALSVSNYQQLPHDQKVFAFVTFTPQRLQIPSQQNASLLEAGRSSPDGTEPKPQTSSAAEHPERLGRVVHGSSQTLSDKSCSDTRREARRTNRGRGGGL